MHLGDYQCTKRRIKLKIVLITRDSTLTRVDLRIRKESSIFLFECRTCNKLNAIKIFVIQDRPNKSGGFD